MAGAPGIGAVVAHLHARGHRRVASLRGPCNTSYALHRYSGYQAALAAHALPPDERLVARDLQERAETAGAVAQLLTLPAAQWPTAFVCSSDPLARDVMIALRECGRPAGSAGGCAVTGFDDLPFAAYLHPALTTVR